jgi:hypothetical protein
MTAKEEQCSLRSGMKFVCVRKAGKEWQCGTSMGKAQMWHGACHWPEWSMRFPFWHEGQDDFSEIGNLMVPWESKAELETRFAILDCSCTLPALQRKQYVLESERPRRGCRNEAHPLLALVLSFIGHRKFP